MGCRWAPSLPLLHPLPRERFTVLRPSHTPLYHLTLFPPVCRQLSSAQQSPAVSTCGFKFQVFSPGPSTHHPLSRTPTGTLISSPLSLPAPPTLGDTSSVYPPRQHAVTSQGSTVHSLIPLPARCTEYARRRVRIRFDAPRETQVGLLVLADPPGPCAGGLLRLLRSAARRT